MKKILFLALFVSMFAILAHSAYGKSGKLTDEGIPDDGSVPSFEGNVSSDLANLENKIQELQNDPDVMKAAAGLASNPDLQALVNDPRVVSAAKSLDLKTLSADQESNGQEEE